MSGPTHEDLMNTLHDIDRRVSANSQYIATLRDDVRTIKDRQEVMVDAGASWREALARFETALTAIVSTQQVQTSAIEALLGWRNGVDADMNKWRGSIGVWATILNKIGGWLLAVGAGIAAVVAWFRITE